MDKKEYFAVGILLFVFALGIVAGYLTKSMNPETECSTKARIAGLWLPDIKELANYNGRYICVNIDETTTLDRLESVCNHEIGHEIFARECEDNLTKCKEVVG